MRGASRSSRTLGAGCDGRFGSPDERSRADGKIAWSWPPDAEVKLADDYRRRRWLNSPAHRGDRVYAVTPSCREGRIAPVEPVVSNSCAFSTSTRGRGCDQHPAFPAPSIFPGDANEHSSGEFAPRERGNSSLREAQRRSNPCFSKLRNGLLRFARNDGEARTARKLPYLAAKPLTPRLLLWPIPPLFQMAEMAQRPKPLHDLRTLQRPRS